MKYNILIKAVNSIPSANAENKVDIGRIRFLCDKLGRVNVGGGYIYTSGGEFAHATGLMLESVMKSAGYSVGRITDAYGFDIKRSVFLDGISPSIEDYTNILTYIRDILKKNKDIAFLREEVVFVFCLYVCKTLGVKYVILENTRRDTTPMFEVCTPYNFAIIPKLYGEASESELDYVSRAIDKVNRGVVTGNNHLYKYFSGRCHKAGIRLSIHRSVDVVEESMRRQIFMYNKREYVLKSSSATLRDSAISVLELIDMMKNHSAKIAPSAISDGIKNAGSCGLFEVISLSPMIISDASSSPALIDQLAERVIDLCGKNKLSGVCVCFDTAGAYTSAYLSDAFSKIPNVELCTVAGLAEGNVKAYASYKDIALGVLSAESGGRLTLILGGFDFTENVKNAIMAKMNRL